MDVKDLATVYVDENGSFVREEGDVSGIAALVARHNVANPDSLREVFDRIDSLAGADERIRGRVKGSKLKAERYELLTDLCAERRVTLCQLIAHANEEPDEELVRRSRAEFAHQVRQKASEIGRSEDGEEYAKALETASPVELVYGTTVFGVFSHGVVQRLAGGLPDRIDIVFDPRGATSRFPLYLKHNVNLAFTNQLHRSMSKQISGVIGDAGYPWNVREATESDRPGLALTDWLAYPRYAVNRPDLPESRRKVYLEILSMMQRKGVDTPVNYYRPFTPRSST